MIGASVDAKGDNARFREEEGFAYAIVSDPTRELARELGLLREIEGYGLRARRFTYLLGADGTIERIWKVGGGDAIDAHPGEVLEALR